MTDTESSKTWITSKTIAIAARIPHHIHNQIEAYGRENFPKGEQGYDKTATILDLLRRGLEMGEDGSVLQSVKHTVNQETVEQLVKQIVTQELSNIVKQEDLDDAISQSQIIQEMLERLGKLNHGSTVS